MRKTIEPIAHIHTDFPAKFGLPRQGGLVEGLMGRIVMEKDYRRPEAFRSIEGYSHLWLIWGFSENGDAWSPTVRPPRLGGNTRVGVFATRSPFRPNGLGMSAVRLVSLENDPDLGPVLVVDGIDMVDGTPIYDIKPYVSVSDCIADAVSGFSDGVKSQRLDVSADQKLLEKLPENMQAPLLEVLAQDPRPHYQDDPDRLYGFTYGNYEIKFKVMQNTLLLVDILVK